MGGVAIAMHCDQIKAVAIEASALALTWRKRYEHLDALAHLEKPFQWTDPAEPILKYANWPGVVLFESHNPFAVPHIMICTPPQQDPWIPYSNAVSDPQDGGFGRYLVVPSHLVNFINVPNLGFDDYDEAGCEQDYSDMDSPPDTPEPETPVDLEDNRDYFPTSRWQLDETDDTFVNEIPATTKWDDDRSWGEPQRKHDDLPPRPSQPIFYMDDDEEDDLPPLDDWYLSVASRNGLRISC